MINLRRLIALVPIWLDCLAVPAASLPPALEAILDTKSSNVNQHRRVFVRYKSGHHDAVLDVLQETTRLPYPYSATEVLYDFRTLHAYVLNVESQEEIQTIFQHPLVKAVHEDPPRACPMTTDYTYKREGSSTVRSSWETQTIPYGVEMVQAPLAWQAGVKGAGVKVCMIGTGIDYHHIDLNQSSIQGYHGSSPWYKDEIGHGTHLAGIITAINNQIGLVGVAPEAQIYTVKIDTDESGNAYSSNIIHAALACRDAGARIIHVGFGGTKGNPFELEAFSSLLESDGILSFAAAGNDGGRRPSYPAAYSVVTGVASVDRARNHDIFSQQNARVDLAAPGVGILGLLPKEGCRLCEKVGTTKGYGVASGSELAAAHAAGVAALLWSYRPEASAKQILQAMEESATDLGDPGRDHSYGFGLVGAMDAIDWLSEGPAAEQQSLSSSFPMEASNQDADGVEKTCAPGFVPFELMLITDAYAKETTWELGHATKESELLFRESNLEENTTYNWHKCLPGGCYTFVIHDTGGDGICCDYGEGSFSVSFDGKELLRGGEFLDEEFVTMGPCSDSKPN